jgi:hypothetical protein
MIDVANKWDDYEMKNALVKVIANHMKKSYLSWNKDKGRRFFEHLYELSDGKLDQSTEELIIQQIYCGRTSEFLIKLIQWVRPKIQSNKKL